MSKTKPEELKFVDAPLHELLKHSRTVSNNMQAEQFEAEKMEAAEKFGFTSEGSDNGNEDQQGDQPQAAKDGKRKGRSVAANAEKVPELVSGEGNGAGGTAGPEGEVLTPTGDEPEGEAGENPDGEKSPEELKNPWD